MESNPEKASKSNRNYLLYIVMLVIFILPMYWIIQQGKLFDTGALLPQTSLSPTEIFTDSLSHNVIHPVALLLLQIIAILIAVRIFSYIFRYIGQPGVIGEIVAGIFLGPSVLGYFFPEVFHFLFAPESLEPLNILSQIGLILFMFVIGMELDLGILKQKASETLVISHASIVVPFFLGVVLAYYVYPEFGAGHTDFLSFSLFIGISVSITAFPVLARIIQERNLSKTKMGKLAIASAANNDITAWCMLAAIIAIAQAGSVVSAFFTIAAASLYIIFMFLVMRPFLRKMGNLYNNQEVMNKTFISLIFLVLIISACITEILGVHALFGAFLAGVIMPDNISFRRVMTEKVEDVALVLFLPLFFVFTGLRTELGLLNSPHLWAVCGVFIVISIAGKLIGAAFSARLVGESWKDSLSIGVLMNTRGLMELIVLNIGFEMGIIPSSIFVIFVIMALFTTFMATPSLALIERIFKRKARKAVHHPIHNPRILVSVGNAQSGKVFIQLIRILFGRRLEATKVTGIHYIIGTDINPINAEEFADESFSFFREEARKTPMRFVTEYKVTDHFIKEIKHFSRKGEYDLVLVGSGPQFISDFINTPHRNLLQNAGLQRLNNLLHDHYRNLPDALHTRKDKGLFHEINRPLGIFVNNHFHGAKQIGIMLSTYEERRLLSFCETIDAEIEVEVCIPNARTKTRLQPRLETLTHHYKNVRLCPDSTPLHFFTGDKHLLLISYDSFVLLAEEHPEMIPRLPSFVVMKSVEEKEKKEEL